MRAGGGAGGSKIRGRVWGKVRLREVGKREGKVGKGEGDAFGAGSDDIYTVVAVVGEGRVKNKRAVPYGVKGQERRWSGPEKARHS